MLIHRETRGHVFHIHSIQTRAERRGGREGGARIGARREFGATVVRGVGGGRSGGRSRLARPQGPFSNTRLMTFLADGRFGKTKMIMQLITHAAAALVLSTPSVCGPSCAPVHRAQLAMCNVPDSPTAAFTWATVDKGLIALARSATAAPAEVQRARKRANANSPSPIGVSLSPSPTIDATEAPAVTKRAKATLESRVAKARSICEAAITKHKRELVQAAFDDYFADEIDEEELKARKQATNEQTSAEHAALALLENTHGLYASAIAARASSEQAVARAVKAEGEAAEKVDEVLRAIEAGLR